LSPLIPLSIKPVSIRSTIFDAFLSLSIIAPELHSLTPLLQSSAHSTFIMVVISKKTASVANSIIRDHSNRDARSESNDSFSSTIDVYSRSKRGYSSSLSFDTFEEPANNGSSSIDKFVLVGDDSGADNLELHFDLSPRSEGTISDNSRLKRALFSIVVLHSTSCKKVQNLLKIYDGHLINIGPHLLKGLYDAAPKLGLAARVGDWNENLSYEMQDCEKDLKSIILDGSYRGGIQCQGGNIEMEALDLDFQEFEFSLCRALGNGNVCYRGSFMQTESTMYQPAHVDYDYQILQKHGNKLFLAFFPLTEEGAFLQLWKDQAPQSAMNENKPTVEGTVVFIPFGKMFLVPSQTIHGGGFKRGDEGNLRFHLYIAMNDADCESNVDSNGDLLNHPMNKYTEENDKRRELCERFVNAKGLDCLTGEFFDD